MSAPLASLEYISSEIFTPVPPVNFLEMVIALDSAAITSHQLLTAVLTIHYTYDDAHCFAQALLNDFGSLAGIVNASRERVCSLVKISRSAWASIQVMRKFAAAVMKESFEDRPVIGNVDDVLRYLMVTIGLDLRESARVLFLDNRNRLIKDEIHSQGTLNFTSFHLRELLLRTSELRASSIIIAHNHPSGSVSPSTEDKVMTNNIRDALKLIGAQLADSLIIGRDATYSFRKQGWLS